MNCVKDFYNKSIFDDSNIDSHRISPLAGHPDILYYTEHKNEVSSEDILLARAYCQNKFPFQCKQ